MKDNLEAFYRTQSRTTSYRSTNYFRHRKYGNNLRLHLSKRYQHCQRCSPVRSAFNDICTNWIWISDTSGSGRLEHKKLRIGHLALFSLHSTWTYDMIHYPYAEKTLKKKKNQIKDLTRLVSRDSVASFRLDPVKHEQGYVVDHFRICIYSLQWENCC